ncbi:hypothetical protein BSKO_09846 [Bryopsis sp. KO-2023]|nr:hypothetical protein BSKO_09846 [Bryopsis sp. KO-2023]
MNFPPSRSTPGSNVYDSLAVSTGGVAVTDVIPSSLEFPYATHNPGVAPHGPDVVGGLSGHQQQLPWQYLQIHNQAGGTGTLSERDLKTLKRKQANRDAARRSKIRRKLEAQALAARLKILKAENGLLEQEVTSLRAALSTLVERNRMGRTFLEQRAISTDEFPPITTEFAPPKPPKLVATHGPSLGDKMTCSIPEVLEFSRQYGPHLGLGLDSAHGDTLPAHSSSQSSPMVAALSEGVAIELDHDCDDVLFLDGAVHDEGVFMYPDRMGEADD